jgi:hypothetical protein
MLSYFPFSEHAIDEEHIVFYAVIYRHIISWSESQSGFLIADDASEFSVIVDKVNQVTVITTFSKLILIFESTQLNNHSYSLFCKMNSKLSQ